MPAKKRELGVRLIERRPRGGGLTAAGAFLANHVLRAEALLVQAARNVSEFREQPTGALGRRRAEGTRPTRPKSPASPGA